MVGKTFFNQKKEFKSELFKIIKVFLASKTVFLKGGIKIKIFLMNKLNIEIFLKMFLELHLLKNSKSIINWIAF